MTPKSAKYMHVRARRTARKKRNQFFIGGEILPQSAQAWEISPSTVCETGISNGKSKVLEKEGKIRVMERKRSRKRLWQGKGKVRWRDRRKVIGHQIFRKSQAFLIENRSNGVG